MVARGVASRLEPVANVADRLRRGERSFSFEFFPPKDEAGAAQLWQAIRRLEALHPTFVSVTYGAGGSNRGTVIDVTRRIGEQTTLTAMAHLTLVGHSRSELRQLIGSYADAGVNHILALRGDPPGGPSVQWVAHPEGLTRAVELVELAKSLGGFTVGVAAFPNKHPQAPDLEADARILAEKARAGADFAVTQLFFVADDYFALVDRLGRLGVELPVLPGIMPVLNLRQVSRMAELSGVPVPSTLIKEFEPLKDDPAAVRAKGIELASKLCRDLLDRGAPGLHFYTLNRSGATREIFANVVSKSSD
jgi:methylenetetrahydrofolate reductase (NADH)